MGEPENLPRDSKVRLGQAPVKRAVAWIVMQHRNLRAMPNSPDCTPICVPRPIAILQEGDQELPRQPQFLSQFRGSQLRAARHDRAQPIYNLVETACRIVPVLLDLHDIAAPFQESEDRRKIAAKLTRHFLDARWFGAGGVQSRHDTGG